MFGIECGICFLNGRCFCFVKNLFLWYYSLVIVLGNIKNGFGCNGSSRMGIYYYGGSSDYCFLKREFCYLGC